MPFIIKNKPKGIPLNGILIRSLRQKKKLTVREFSKIVNISATSLSKYENNERSPTLYRAKIIADALNVELSKLVKS